MIIQKGIPIPQYSKKFGYMKYNLKNMKVGDSFIYKGTTRGAHSIIFQNRMRLGYNFIQDTTIYGNIRIWRVS
jgi:hypothetical protein